MGIVIRQSIKNTIITYIGFVIGAANTLFMYPVFLGAEYYGVTGYILSTANIIFPLMAFGVHNTLIKFFSQYKTDAEKGAFLSFVLLLPIGMTLLFLIVGYFGYESIVGFESQKNPLLRNYVWQVPVIGLCMGYFEIFYAWVKANLQSVFGSFIKEIVLRVLITIFLFGVYFKWISIEDFVLSLIVIYFTTTLVMFFYAMKVNPIQFSFVIPTNKRSILSYSIFIILSGSIANMLLDIDKNMLAKYVTIENIAYYSVAIFIATVISVPSRAMHQITYPITAQLMTENKYEELNDLYKRTSITLQLIGGLVLVGILVNLKQLYLLLPNSYSGGIFVVFVIGFSKYIDLILGNNNAIIFNSKYYKTILFLGILLAFLAIILNIWLIPIHGINGAAIATLISVTLYSIAKLSFVVLKMKLFPFTNKTLVSFVILLVTFFSFYFWELPFQPFVNIILKSIMVSSIYIFLIYKLKISEDITIFINFIFVKLKKIIKLN